MARRTDSEAVEPAGGGQPVLRNRADDGACRTLAQRGEDRLEGRLRALGHDLDAAVGLVGDPATKPQSRCLAQDEEAVPDALDLAANDGLEPVSSVRRPASPAPFLPAQAAAPRGRQPMTRASTRSSGPTFTSSSSPARASRTRNRAATA
jgi:hypothetical protein